MPKTKYYLASLHFQTIGKKARLGGAVIKLMPSGPYRTAFAFTREVTLPIDVVCVCVCVCVSARVRVTVRVRVRVRVRVKMFEML